MRRRGAATAAARGSPTPSPTRDGRTPYAGSGTVRTVCNPYLDRVDDHEFNLMRSRSTLDSE